MPVAPLPRVADPSAKNRRKNPRCNLDALELARIIVGALEAKKGEDILLLDLVDVASFTDYFVLCTGTSDRMLDALAETALETVRKEYRRRGKKEGEAREGWVVVDYGDVVVHLFSADQREYYDLEGLWQDGKVLLRVQ
jgi:ribosome-associated protein